MEDFRETNFKKIQQLRVSGFFRLVKLTYQE